jgi:cystathionine gamma-synthase
VHGGERGRLPSEAVTTPIYQTSTFWFRDSAELREYQEGRLVREEYGRYGNPTWKAVERKLCELEGAEEAVLFASGMCAATTLFLALLPRGAHLVVTSDCYRRTRQFIREYLTRLDVETTVIDPADTRQLAAALRDQTALFFTECPTNPYLRVIDVPEAVRVCHARGTRVVVDATFASPVCYRPLADGADFVIHSATKYLGGHNDLLAGVVAGSSELVAPVRRAVGVLGGVLDAHAAWLLLRGLKTLALRMERHNANALRVASWLESQPKVRRVWYPGLASHPDHGRLPRAVHRAEPGRRRVAGRDARADVLLGRRARGPDQDGHHRLADPPLLRHRGRGRPARRPRAGPRRDLTHR